MALLRNNKLHLLDTVVCQVTNGVKFVSWAESIAQSLVDRTSKGKNIIEIEKILHLRNIILHNVLEPEISTTYKANLINNKSHYDLFLNSQKISSEFEKKFILAHEIAHTLFYSDADKGLQKNISLSFGSTQIEDICDYIAVCILLPKSFILSEIEQYTREKDTLRKRNENFLNFVFHLSLKYQIDWHYVLYRLIANYQFLPSSLCIEFIRRDKWHLSWVYQTDSLTQNNLFIPIKSKSQDQRFVSAKKSFLDIIERIEKQSNLKANYNGSLIVKKEHFNSYYQGNFKQFLNNYFEPELDILKIYYRVNHKNSVLLLFPFDGLVRFKSQSF